MLLVLEQTLNGLQFGVMLFLMAAGLTLVFGIMNLINLAHGSFYMVGAFVAASVTTRTGSFLSGVVAAMAVAGVLGLATERLAIRVLYRREHLDQVLVTFGLILFFNEAAAILWGPQALFLDVPPALAGTVEILPDAPYPTYRLAIIVAGVVVALALRQIVSGTRIGMMIRAGASLPQTLGALGGNVTRLHAVVFAGGALLAGLAGALSGPLLAVQVGMGENILILTFVVIIIGGVGSVRGAFIGALLVGLVDTWGRAFLPGGLRYLFDPSVADGVGASLASMAIYILMAAVLIWRPRGLFPAHG